MGDRHDILCTVIILSILVFGSVFEETILPTVESQLSTTLKITKLTTGGDGTFDFTVDGPTLYNPSINTAGAGGVLIDSLNIGDTDYTLVNPLNSPTIKLGLIIPFNGESISKVTFRVNSEGLSSNSLGTIKAVIYSGVNPADIEAGDTTFTLLASSTETFRAPWDNDGAGGSFLTTGYHDVVATFDPPVTVSGSDILVGVEAVGLEDNPVTLLVTNAFVPIQGEICSEWIFPTDFRDCQYEVSMRIEGSASGGIGIDGPTPVVPGLYSIQETIPAGWDLTTATCNDGSSSFSVDTVSGILVNSGNNIQCTFENTFGIDHVISDQASCEASPISGVWDGIDTCTISSLTLNPEDSLTINPGITLVYPSLPGPLSIVGQITNNGIVNVDQMYIETTGVFINNGILNNQNTVLNFGNLINGVNGIIFSNQWVNIGNIERFVNDGRFDSTAIFTGESGSSVTNNGVFNIIDSPFELNQNGGNTLTNNGVINISTSGTLIALTGDAISNHGEINNDGGVTITDGSTLTNYNDGVITNNNIFEIHNPETIFINNGIVNNNYIIDNTGYIDNFGTINNICGTVINNGIIFRNSIIDICNSDIDRDGIYNEVDTLPNTSSDDFSDIALGGTSSGSITTRGDQILTITEEPNPAGVRINADISGGSTPATVSVCGGASTIDLSPGDEIVVTCGSVTVKTISGVVEVVLIASDGIQASTSIPSGNEITFEPQTSAINSNPQNTDTIVIMSGNTTIPLSPGSSDYTDIEPPEITINSLINDGNSFPFGNVPPAPTCTAQDVLSGVVGGCSVIGYQTGVGTHQIQFSASDLAGNTNTITIHYQVLPWSILGFYNPVDMGGVVNTVKGGSTVSMKFEVFAGSIERTSTSDISSFTQNSISCTTLLGHPEDAVEITTTGSTGLKYTSGQFHANWKTPQSPNTCWEVKVTTIDGTNLSAFFKLK